MSNINDVYYFQTEKSQQPAEFRPAQNIIVITDLKEEQEHITLSHSETKVLELLIQDAGETKSREELLSYAWGSRVVSAGSLNQCIFSIRSLLGDDRNHEIIQTIPRRGYRFNLDYALPAPALADTHSLTIQHEARTSGPGISLSNSAALTDEEISMLTEGSDEVFDTETATAGWGWLRGAVAITFGFSVLLSLLLSSAYSNPILNALGPEISFQTVYRQGVTINVFALDSGKTEFSEYIAKLQLPPSILSGVAWVYTRQYDIGLSCIKQTGEAINTTVPYQGDWKVNFVVALSRCLQ